MGFSAGALADAVMMPFACAFDTGALMVSPSKITTYRIIGRREERTARFCHNSMCRDVQVHKFAIDCGGHVALWSDVAAAAENPAAVRQNPKFAQGYAPLTALSARLSFPPLMPAAQIERVSRQDLPPDDGNFADDGGADVSGAPWLTSVRAAVTPAGTQNVGRLAWVVMTMLALASVTAWATARRAMTVDFGGLWNNALRSASAGLQTAREHLSAQFNAGLRSARKTGDPSIASRVSVLELRLTEAEFAVAAVPAHLKLRETLSAELAASRRSLAMAADLTQRRARASSSTAFKMIARDIERIKRIALSASSGSQSPATAADREARAPQTLADAYEILGLNGEASPHAIKKLVDALRASWHPDHARGDADRARREARMKQINAAWDIIRSEHRAAA